MYFWIVTFIQTSFLNKEKNGVLIYEKESVDASWCDNNFVNSHKTFLGR